MITFGTSGWRAVLGEEFTFDNARRVVAAIARVAKGTGDAGRGLLVACDTRFLGERFVDEAARVLAREGVRPVVADRDVPTPVVAYTIRRLGALGAINFTASHNPPEYNGIKFSTADGAPALPEVTKKIEAEIARTAAADAASAPKARYETVDPRGPYLEELRHRVSVSTLGAARMTVGVDPRFGTSRGYLDAFLSESGCTVTPLHTHRDAMFGGLSPQCDAKNLEELGSIVREKGLRLGLATDGDADRFGVLDADGSYVNPNLCLMLLADRLLSRERATRSAAERNGSSNRGVARSVATTHGLDAVAKAHGAPVYTTPVGFKYIGELLLADKIVLGGEESAGFTMVGHVPEKDGILADLLLAEMVAETGKTLKELLEELFARVGRFAPARADLHLDPDLAAKVKKRLAENPSTFDGRKVASVDRTDGQKLLLGESRWILFRPSGTEPVVRIYAETPEEGETEALLAAAKRYVMES